MENKIRLILNNYGIVNSQDLEWLIANYNPFEFKY